MPPGGSDGQTRTRSTDTSALPTQGLRLAFALEFAAISGAMQSHRAFRVLVQSRQGRNLQLGLIYSNFARQEMAGSTGGQDGQQEQASIIVGGSEAAVGGALLRAG